MSLAHYWECYVKHQCMVLGTNIFLCTWRSLFWIIINNCKNFLHMNKVVTIVTTMFKKGYVYVDGSKELAST